MVCVAEFALFASVSWGASLIVAVQKQHLSTQAAATKLMESLGGTQALKLAACADVF